MSASAVQQFLESHELGTYFAKFVDEGYDTMNDVMDLDLDALIDDIGMKKGHAKRFLKHIRDANTSTASVQAEGCCSTDPGTGKAAQHQPPLNAQTLATAAATQDEEQKCAKVERYPERRDWSGIRYVEYQKVEDVSCVTGSGRMHKVILVIGETGTGKSTLLDSMTNYLYDVSYGDKFRFKLINEDELKKQRQGKHASMTDDVTAYYLEPTNPKVGYNLTVIDTPGFGDTRGLDKDQEIVDKIKKFFETKMNTITGICLVVKASNTRLTAAQQYIFSTLLGLFGKDIEENIFVLVTFCDAKKPPCIGALKATKTPYKQLFKLNNSAFFLDEDAKEDDDEHDDDDDEDDADFNENCWNMGIKSFEKFFGVIGRTTDKGLGMTKQVLQNRERLLVSIENLHNKIRQGTAKLSELQATKFALESLKDRMNQHQAYQITVEVEEEYKQPLPVSTYTTVCIKCRYTCHRICGIPNDDDKAGCAAITNNYCRYCPQRCHWTEHANRPYTWERRPTKQVKTDEDIKKKYGKAKAGMSEAEHVLTSIEKEIFNLKVDVLDLIKAVSKANDELKKYALKHNPVGQSEYIKMMILSERRDMKLGWAKRIESLQNLQGMLTTLQSIDSNDYDAKLKEITLFSGSASVKIDKQQEKGYLDRLKEKANSWFN